MLLRAQAKQSLAAIIVFALVGIVFAFVALTAYFGSEEASALCSINETFDCDIVNQSSYSEMFGIPVSVLGMLAYGFFIFLAVVLLIVGGQQETDDSKQKKAWPRFQKITTDIITVFAVVGLAFSLYLTSIEAFVLKTWCIMCIGSQICILAITILAFRLRSLTAR